MGRQYCNLRWIANREWSGWAVGQVAHPDDVIFIGTFGLFGSRNRETLAALRQMMDMALDHLADAPIPPEGTWEHDKYQALGSDFLIMSVHATRLAGVVGRIPA